MHEEQPGSNAGDKQCSQNGIALPDVKLQTGQNIEYIITDNGSAVPNDRVRAIAFGNRGLATTARNTPRCCTKPLNRLSFAFESVQNPFFSAIPFPT